MAKAKIDVFANDANWQPTHYLSCYFDRASRLAAEIRQIIEADGPVAHEQKVSRTYGELPESVRNLIAPHEWDNKNISEQRDWALSILAEIQDADYVLNVDRAWKKQQTDVRKETAREMLKWMRTATLSANGDIYYSHLQSKLESMIYTNEKEKKMQPHQERVVREKKELDVKLDKLKTFIETNPIFKTLPQTEQLLLNRQFDAMAEYSHILGQRIAAF